MGRPKINEDQRVRAYQMHVQGFGPSHIRKVLVEEFQDSEEAASLRTVKYWVKQFKSLKEELTRLDSPFQWHKLGQYGLPWEASPFLMEMLLLIQSYKMKVHVLNAQLPPDSTSKTPSIPDTTVREALWWWRVHQAAPEIGVAMGDLDDVREIAGQFAIRELTNEVLGEPFDVTDLEVLLAHKPWLGEERRAAYLSAIEMGLAPPVRGSLTIDQALMLSQAIGEGSILEPAIMGSYRNVGLNDGLLPSQWRKELTRLKAIHRSHREKRDSAEARQLLEDGVAIEQIAERLGSTVEIIESWMRAGACLQS